MDVLITLLAAFFVALSFMSSPSAASHQLHNNLQNSLQKVESDRHVKFTSDLPSLPRKLQLNEEVKSSADKNTFVMPQKDFLESSSGTKQHENEETMMHKIWKEGFEEGPNKSEYFNMDYTWVRKKRPIHN